MDEVARLGFAIPTYRRPELLSRAIESIVPQARVSGAPIYIPDNSCDHTNIEVIEKWRSVYPNIIHEINESNLGIDRNVHRAIVRCPAEYVHVIGDDDIILPGFSERILAALSAGSPGHIICTYMYLLNNYAPTTGLPIIPHYEPITSLRAFLPRHGWTLGFIGAHVFHRDRFLNARAEGFDTYFHHIIRLLGYLHPDEEICFLDTPLVGNRVDDESTPTWSGDRLNVVFGLERAFENAMQGKYTPSEIQDTVDSTRRSLGYTQYFRLLYWAAIAERSGDGARYWSVLSTLIPHTSLQRLRSFPPICYALLIGLIPTVRRIKRRFRGLHPGRT